MTFITRIEDLYRLRRLTDLDTVRVETALFKRANVLRYALKYALWAVRPGGTIELVDDGPDTFDITLGGMPFSIVRQHAFKVYRDDAALVELDQRGMRLVFRRDAPVPEAGWSAGIVFSGSENEMPVLARALAALAAQGELQLGAGGQIMVCGPAAARGLLADWPDVEYVVFDEANASRAFTTRKKNAMIDAARNPRVAIMHARIVLQPGCLAAFGREFDVSTPCVRYAEAGHTVPYLDWVVAHDMAFDRLPRRRQTSNYYNRDAYLSQLATGGLPYIDGGLFVGMRAAMLAVPLNPFLAWGEAEDCDWCTRLQAEGYLVDLEPQALALSQSWKLPRRMIHRPGLSALLSGIRRLSDAPGRVLSALRP